MIDQGNVRVTLSWCLPHAPPPLSFPRKPRIQVSQMLDIKFNDLCKFNFKINTIYCLYYYMHHVGWCLDPRFRGDDG